MDKEKECEKVIDQEESSDLNNNQEDINTQTNETVETEIIDEKQSDESETKLESLTEQLKQLEVQLEDSENRLLRVQADYDNYKRRTRGEFAANEKYRSQSLATELLPAIDNFERALKVEAESEEAKAILQGMQMVYQNILDAFKKEGIEQIEAVGKEFDPVYHHAVMQDEDESVESNTVLDEFQKGYMLKDRVIRPSMVKVNK